MPDEIPDPAPRAPRRRARLTDLYNVTDDMIKFADVYQQAWENEAKATIALGEFLNFRSQALRNQVELMRMGSESFRRYNEWSEAIFGVRPDMFMRGMLEQLERTRTPRETP